jgi:hypothetical protein
MRVVETAGATAEEDVSRTSTWLRIQITISRMCNRFSEAAADLRHPSPLGGKVVAAARISLKVRGGSL